MKKVCLLKKLFFATMFCAPFLLNAQVTIGSSDAPRATLDVRVVAGTPAGVIAPNVTRAYLDVTDYINPVSIVGAIVYVTDEAPAGSPTNVQAANVTAPGYYYFDGTVWQPFGGGEPSPTFVVSAPITSSFTITNEDYLALNVSTPGQTLTFPTSGVPVGRIIYASNIGAADIGLQPAMRNNAYNLMPAGVSAVFVYLGGTGDGSWDCISGY